jgi:uncharacterized small protein (DUF1192 family)
MLKVTVLSGDLQDIYVSASEADAEIARLEAEVERLNGELKMCNRSRKWWKDLAYAAGAEKISCRAATIKHNEALRVGNQK